MNKPWKAAAVKATCIFIIVADCLKTRSIKKPMSHLKQMVYIIRQLLQKSCGHEKGEFKVTILKVRCSYLGSWNNWRLVCERGWQVHHRLPTLASEGRLARMKTRGP